MKNLYNETKELKQSLIDYLKENPESYTIEETEGKSAYHYVRIYIDNETSMEKEIRNAIFFKIEDKSPESIAESRVKYINRFGNDGNVLYQAMLMEQEGRSEKINKKITEILGKLDIFQDQSNKVIGNHKAAIWENLRNGLLFSGVSKKEADEHQETLQKSAKYLILLNTPLNKNSLLASEKHVASSVMSTLGQVQTIREFPDLEDEIKEINSKIKPDREYGQEMQNN